MNKIPLDDDKTFKLFKKGHTIGVFQLESSGMRRYLVSLDPSIIEDIIVMISLYRPGPMEFIPDYIARKKGLKNKLCELLENLLIFHTQRQTS